MKSSMEAKTTGGTLGTFAGVFTPGLLTILGIILFFRLGFVIGNAGFASALINLALANLITISMAPVITVRPWVLNLGRLMRISASRIPYFFPPSASMSLNALPGKKQ